MKFDLVCTLGMMAGTAAFGGGAAGADLPASWRLASKELVVDIFRDGGRIDVRDLRTGRSWVAAANLTSGNQLPPWKAVKVTRQQSRFADGTVVTVNFGERPFTCADGRELAPLSAVVTSVKGSGR